MYSAYISDVITRSGLNQKYFDVQRVTRGSQFGPSSQLCVFILTTGLQNTELFDLGEIFPLFL